MLDADTLERRAIAVLKGEGRTARMADVRDGLDDWRTLRDRLERALRALPSHPQLEDHLVNMLASMLDSGLPPTAAELEGLLAYLKWEWAVEISREG